MIALYRFTTKRVKLAHREFRHGHAHRHTAQATADLAPIARDTQVLEVKHEPAILGG